MITADNMALIFERASNELPTWDLRDQLIYTRAMADFAAITDDILAKYDGRDNRTEELLEALGIKG